MENFFLLISSFCFASAIFVIGSINPIHSILLLILVFFFGSILLLMLNMEFFAVIFLIVYVGAIAVLFLFIIMTLDIKISNISQKLKDFFSYKSVFICLILLNLLIFLQEDYFYFLFNQKENIYIQEYLDYAQIIKFETSLEILGKILFKEYIIPFLYCGFILFIAMIGAIVITLEDFYYKNVKQQNTVHQIFKTNFNSTFNFKIYSIKKYKKLF